MGCVKMLGNIYRSSSPATFYFQKYIFIRSRYLSTQNSWNENFDKFFKTVQVTFDKKNGDGKLDLDVNIWDGYKGSSKNEKPVVMALHGAPGGSMDFIKLAENLVNNDYRVIIPDLPGFGDSRLAERDAYMIDHSAVGRSKMLQAIIKALNLKRVDVLVSHSAGSWMAYYGCAENNQIKSAVFINPLGIRPHSALRPYWLLKLFNFSLKYPPFNKVMRAILPTVYGIVGFKVKNTAISELMVSVEIVSTSDFEKIKEDAQKISSRKMPFIFGYATNDKLVEKEIAEEMFELMEGDLRNSFIYNAEDNLIKKGDDLQGEIFKRILCFQSGGHVLQHKKADILTSHIEHLIQHIRESES